MKSLKDTLRPSVWRTRRAYWTVTSPVRLQPDFLIIGAERCGTTSLYNYLIEHPHIAPASKKEVHFFDHSYNFERGTPWYRAQFPTVFHKYYAMGVKKQPLITGEASPNYLFHPHTPKRIARILPMAKFILMLRNPVARAYSHYWLKVGQGVEKLSFEEAIEREEERTREEWGKILKDETYFSLDHWHNNCAYLSRGIYADQLQAWFKYFPREQFLILKSEDFYADPAATFKETLTFLNIPTIIPESLQKEFKQYNSFTKSKMDPATRERLVTYFEPHNARLYELLGRDFGWK